MMVREQDQHHHNGAAAEAAAAGGGGGRALQHSGWQAHLEPVSVVVRLGVMATEPP